MWIWKKWTQSTGWVLTQTAPPSFPCLWSHRSLLPCAYCTPLTGTIPILTAAGCLTVAQLGCHKKRCMCMKRMWIMYSEMLSHSSSFYWVVLNKCQNMSPWQKIFAHSFGSFFYNFVVVLFVFWNKGSVCSPSWPWLGYPSISAFQVLDDRQTPPCLI